MPGPIDTTLNRLYNAANDSELSMLDDLAVRAGLMWQCESERCAGWMNPTERDRCENCGAKRPAVAA